MSALTVAVTRLYIIGRGLIFIIPVLLIIGYWLVSDYIRDTISYRWYRFLGRF
jgi:hypothetical protein